ncbi:Hint domain-containing protein [Acetobacter sp. UBA5411]|uniref:Hint domain-containing protein n=1 Tax=Acetobacter sp. UBA5411 TaxID=1945905 RepID=UPI0025BD7BB4|nr:Hint domain-containing protein [Acetobacter sp. UBA5411]
MTAITSGNSATNIAVTAADPLIVEHGATATTPTISIGGIAEVSGVVVSGTVLSGGSLQIMSGGVASNTTISSQGLEVVSSGGLESGAIVQSFGIIDIASGGVASAIQLNAGADPTYYNSNGYTPDGANVVNLSSAESASGPLAAKVESGGLLNSATVGDASVIVSSGGSAANIIMQSANLSGPAWNNGVYALITVSSGGSISNISVGDNDEIIEYGSEANITIGGNGATNLPAGYSGGRVTNTYDALESPTALARNDTVSSGAALMVSQGSALDTTVTDGGIFVITSGMASGVTITTSDSDAALASLQDAEANFDGGTTSDVTAHYAYLHAHGASTTVTGVTIDSSGWLNVDSQGTVLSTTLTDGASATVSGSARLESGSAAGNGTSLTVSGATISDFQISDSGTATVSSGGLLKQTILDTNASASVLSGGQTVSTTLSSSTSEEVASGGMATATDLLSGAMLSIDVGAGFAADGTVVNSGAAFTVNSGVTAQNTTISRGGNVFVLSGGTVSATILASADTSSGQAYMDVESGATAFDTQINPGAIVYIESGAVDSDTIIGGSPSAVRALQVMLGGTSYNLQVLEDGFLIAGQQGTAVELYNPTASGNQATLYVDVHATEYGGVVKDGGKQILYGVVSGLTVSNGGVQNILSVALVPTQASAVGDIIDSGGQVLQDGGYVENAVISSGGILSQTSGIASQYGGVAIATQIMDGGSAIIGTIGSATVVSSGGTEVIQSGGLESGGTVSGGLLTISSGGSAVHTTIYDGGLAVVSNGGVISNTNLSGPTDTQAQNTTLWISSGGSAYGTTVFHDQMIVDSGAYASGITLDQAGMTISGAVDDLTVNAQNSNYYGVFVEGGTVSSATILSGAGIAVSDNGSIHNDTIGSNSMELLLSSNGGGATSYDADILSGGLLSAYNEDVTVISATVEGGGKLRVTQNAVANAASVSGTMAVDSNGSAIDTQILAGGMFTVGDPSLSENAIISSGGTMILSSGGIGSNTLVQAGGQETVSSGSVESGGTVSGGLLTVSSGGSTASVTLSATTVVPVLLVENGGSVSGTLVTQSAVAVISGLAANTTVYEGGNLRVGSQGVTSDTFISGPSDTESTHPGLWVSAGGSACDTTVFHDTMVLDADAQASGITLNDAGMTVKGTVDDITINYQNSAVPAYGLFIDGGTVSGVTGSQAHIEVYDNGSIYNDKIESGSVEYVYSASGAGTSYDADIQSGGRLSTFNAGAQVISATVEVGGTFQVKDQALADNAFVSGTMTINSNGSATDTQILAGGQFMVGSGSLSENAVVSASGVMTVSSGGVGSATLVRSGGTETVLANGLESGGAVSGGTLIVASGASASSTLVADNGIALVSGSTTSDTISGGQEIVSSGGSASDATIEGGGTLTVLDQAQASTVAVASGTLALSGAGASATSVTLDPDGQITLADGAVLSGDAYSAGTITAQDGGTFESATLSDGAQAGATSGGTLSAVTVQSGAQLTISSGGVGSATQVQSGGTETVLASGLESGGSISGGTLVVSSGGSAFDVSVTAASSSVMLVVESGGLLSSVTVAASAVANITGSAVSTTVHDDGVVAVTSGGVASNTVVSGSTNPEGNNDSFWVSAGGTAYRTSVSHDIMVVDTGGLASGVTLTDAGLILQGSADNLTFSEANVSDYAVYVDGGTVTNLTTSNKATLVLDENGAISGNTIATGGTESIYGLSGSGGTVSGIDIQIDGMLSASGDNVDIVSVTVAMEGQLHITSGALVSSASVSGGTMYVADNGTTRDTQILPNGYLTLGDGGLSEETTLSSTGMMTVSSGAIGSDTLVEAGANEIVQAGGLESGGTVSGDLLLHGSGAKGAQISLLDSGMLDVAGSAVISGLNATNGTIRVETKAEIDDIAIQSGTLTVTSSSIVSSGSLSGSASFTLASSAFAQDLTLTSGTVTSVTGGALLSATRLASDTITTIISAGSGYDLTVSGGQLIVSGGGLVSAATVTDLGDTHVYGGQVSSVTLAGGTMEIDDDGSAIATQVQSGGQFAVGDPSISENAVVSSGGVMTVSSGGIGSNTLVESGGQEIIFSGSLESGGTVSGGQEIVSSGGSTADATIEGGGTLTVLDQAQANTVAVASGTLALSGTGASATSVTLDTDGQITLADGAVLNGSTYSAGTITAQDGGTFENATLSGTAQAGATSGGTLSAVTVQSGAQLTVSSGGVGQGVIVNSGAALQAEADATVDNTTIGSGALLRIDSATINSDTNLTSGGSIELLNTSWSETDTISFTDDILTIDDNGTEIIINLSAADDVYLTKDFVLSQADTDPLYANSNDILVTLAPVACFCRGTLIDTEFGPMLIENILEGTGILTLGGVEALRWKGVRRYSHRQMALGVELRPLVIKADALGEGRPRRDLRVSQLHMLYIDGLFIPAAALINDRTIFIEQNYSEMDYYHLDIGTQNIIFSEGVATESLTDDDASRRGFDNYDQHVAALPSSADMVMAAPLIREGEVIATLQARYAWRAAILDIPLQRVPENDLLFL